MSTPWNQSHLPPSGGVPYGTQPGHGAPPTGSWQQPGQASYGLHGQGQPGPVPHGQGSYGRGPGTVPLSGRPERVSVESYGPPPSKVTPAIVMGVAVASMAVAVFGYTFASRLTPSPAATDTPTAVASPTPTRTGGVPFESPTDRATGYWLVTATEWSGDQLLVTVSVTVDRGQMRPYLFLFSNTDSKVYEPDFDTPSPTFTTGTIRSGQTATGNLRFTLPRSNATLVLTSSGNQQVSALPIRA